MRLIDADALKEDIDNLRLFKKWIREEIKQHIDNAPIVDIWQMRQEATENALKKAEVLYGRQQGEFVKLLKERIDQSVCKWCQMNKHCEICEISRVFMIIDLTDEERKGGTE